MHGGPTNNESEVSLSVYKLYPLFAKAEYKGKVIDLLNEEWPRSITQREISISKCTNPDPPMSFILIEQSAEELIGHGKVCPVPNDINSCWVESVIVVKNRRGKGVGRLLMNFLEEEARKRNYTKMCLSTEEKEVFYRKCGYVDSPPILNFGANSKLFEKFPMKNLEPVSNTNDSRNKTENSSNTSQSSAATNPSPPPPPPCLMNKTSPINKNLNAQKKYMCKYL
ncbi:acetyltransferase (GNAT) family domain-containing protein [Ditylenchus destructor]|uniref:Acetyltransferase (GNAT) family domain-containing protein n=1 Tax=Ditylenchus destructor TaxID=166010 RepID=A0AAD4NLN7_9BILA|nr:acetyltransferase (GNAT) family domain-containing protein [Ditylenchus destructor]